MVEHEARGGQGIGEPLIGDSGDGNKTVGILCRAGHAPETRGDGPTNRVGNANTRAHVREPENDVRQRRQVRGLHRRVARLSGEGFSTRASAGDRRGAMLPDGAGALPVKRGREWPPWFVPTL